MDLRVTSIWMCITTMGRRSATWEKHEKRRGPRSLGEYQHLEECVVFNLGSTFWWAREFEKHQCLGPTPEQLTRSETLGMSYKSSLCMRAKLLQSYRTLCDPMDCSPPSSSVHEIFQARIVQWVAISFARGSSNPGISQWQVDSLPLAQARKPSMLIDNSGYLSLT